MKKSIYVQLVLIFIGVFIISNIVSSIFISLSMEQNLKAQVESQLVHTVEKIKEVYENEKISIEDLEKLFHDIYINIKFIDDVERYDLNEEMKSKLEEEKILVFNGYGHKKFSFSLPVVIAKAGGHYIVAKPKLKDIGFNARSFIMTTNIVSIAIGSIIFLFVGKMIVKPIRRLTKATEKVAAGDFNISLESHRKDEIDTLISSFNTMAKKLKSIEILRSDFISNISHEFKTPLTSIQGYTKLLKDCNEVDKNEYIDIIIEETKRLSMLATNILMLNKIEGENVSIYMEQFSMDEQIRKAILLLENKWSDKDIQLEIDLESVEYKGNQNLMYQVWINLIDNAIKFSPNGENIEIKLYKKHGKIIFSIMDNGTGISKEDQDRVFEKFYKADKSRNTEGNGLGLSIVKRILDIHQGEILLDNSLKKGTKIIVKL
ncbi:hypothetical protein CIW83_12825 [Tissierella sp. P1]|uniref:sensor histidine kinase n=1 Tax=Tissierella sp. P1 TaxID=1280483 RepID=UPI000BA0DFE3|nr:HAMP domain-containing sensor histidine kinase [Tissierella sp. P1]OZV11746.1 hypothetical protein CIW83_12825 [Tissierella sp. P1]